MRCLHLLRQFLLTPQTAVCTLRSPSMAVATVCGLLFWTAIVSRCLADSPTPRPNVILIMTDDQGIGDFGWTGNPVIETPNIDAMAPTVPQ